jgi:hypothetical protein
MEKSFAWDQPIESEEEEVHYGTRTPTWSRQSQYCSRWYKSCFPMFPSCPGNNSFVLSQQSCKTLLAKHSPDSWMLSLHMAWRPLNVTTWSCHRTCVDWDTLISPRVNWCRCNRTGIIWWCTWTEKYCWCWSDGRFIVRGCCARWIWIGSRLLPKFCHMDCEPIKILLRELQLIICREYLQQHLKWLTRSLATTDRTPRCKN